MIARVIKILAAFLIYDLAVRLTGFRLLHKAIRQKTTRRIAPNLRRPVTQLIHEIDVAAVLYFKEVKCLQRSVVTAWVLRNCGWSASVIMGAQLVPLRNHAWVEVGDEVVSDKPYMRDIFQVYEVC